MASSPVATLSQAKRSQLHQSVNDPPFYLDINSYYNDEKLGVTFYRVEIGLMKQRMVRVHVINTRFSELERLDKMIRKDFNIYSMLSKFPPKRYLFNRDRSFLVKRSEDLQHYLSNLTQVPKLLENDTFKNVFKIDFAHSNQ